jgi:zinc transport system substrate-binding protein
MLLYNRLRKSLSFFLDTYMPFRNVLMACLLVLGLSHSNTVSHASPTLSVAVSIKPVHSLVAGLMAGAGKPSLIIKGSRSPHNYNLRPSDARILNQADLIIWMGPTLEMFLEKPILALTKKSQTITLENNINADPHLWLSPIQAATIVDQVLSKIIKIDPDKVDIYNKNAEKLKNRLKKLLVDGRKKLNDLNDIPFLVYHDAWSHFATAFEINIAGAISLNPERPPGAKQISEVRQLIKARGIRCLFKEPQFNSPLVVTILQDRDDIRVLELDPLGIALKPGPDLYFEMMENNIRAVASCL